MIQFYINERGEKQYLLTRPSYHVQKKRNRRRRECMQKVAFAFIFFF